MGIRTDRDAASFSLRDTQEFDIEILAIGIAIDFDCLIMPCRQRKYPGPIRRKPQPQVVDTSARMTHDMN